MECLYVTPGRYWILGQARYRSSSTVKKGYRKMAGALPGVGVPSRRRTKPNREIFPVEKWFRPSMNEAVSSINLDETALKARQRLEKKLGYCQPSSRSSKVEPIEGRSRNHKTQRILVWVQNHIGGYCSSSSESTAMNQTEKFALYA